ncbi:MAG: 4Fe-4S dicluster domain-containing protein [Christensenellales bacterium]
MLRINISDLNGLYNKISEKYPLYLPIKKAGEVNFGLYEEGAEVCLSVLKTNKSPKDAFFPQSEDLMKFKIDGQKIEIIDVREEKKPFVVMGVRACDYKAFDVLDRVFLTDPIDTYYESRRQAGVVVTLACGRPEESCFCGAFGIDPTDPAGDVTAWLTDKYLYLRANTDKGSELLSQVTELAEETDGKETEEQKEAVKNVLEKLPFNKLDPKVFDESMMELFNDGKWNELSEACLGCGTCTFVCPTCQCFDIKEFCTNDGVKRFRCWDSCMYKDFTKTAGGQPRTTQMQRFRQRFMHKLVYYPKNNDGLYSCVGCGRCVKKCPQHLNIVKVIKAFGGDTNE